MWPSHIQETLNRKLSYEYSELYISIRFDNGMVFYLWTVDPFWAHLYACKGHVELYRYRGMSGRFCQKLIWPTYYISFSIVMFLGCHEIALVCYLTMRWKIVNVNALSYMAKRWLVLRIHWVVSILKLRVTKLQHIHKLNFIKLLFPPNIYESNCSKLFEGHIGII